MQYRTDFKITCEKDWHSVIDQPTYFAKLAEFVFEKHDLPYAPLTFITKASNAIFASKSENNPEFIIKFILLVADNDYDRVSFDVELFGINHCKSLGIPTAEILAHGQVQDRNTYNYVIMARSTGKHLTADYKAGLSSAEKQHIGENLQSLLMKMNIPLDEATDFCDRDFMQIAFHMKEWSAFSKAVQQERLDFLKDFRPTEKVFVHADINANNLLVSYDFGLRIIDFADALLAPSDYELPPIVLSLFCSDMAFLRGFFGGENPKTIAHRTTKALLYHYYAPYLIKTFLCPPEQVQSLAHLEQLIFDKLK